MEEKTCKTCRHFRQHYIRYGRSYREAHCGHCVYPRVKKRTPDIKACGYYVPRNEQDLQDENATSRT